MGLYLLSVLIILLFVNLVFANNALSAAADRLRSFIYSRERTVTFGWELSRAVYVTAVTLAVIGFGSIFKIIQFSKGATRIAELFGGRYLDPASEDPSRRRLLNTVEEMAIASGVPVPFTYLLEREKGVNAFAAGSYPGIAVIGVSAGCLESLDREELQAVVAHGFSRILNGDLKLYAKITGLLHGLLLISLLGYLLFSPGSSPGSPGDRQSHFLLTPSAFAGILVMAAGYPGVFLAKRIKKMIMGQREFLADASVLQFTRNPQGLTGALRKTASGRTGSVIYNFHAQESNHIFFADCLPARFRGAFSSHSSPEERIRRAGGAELPAERVKKEEWDRKERRLSLDPVEVLGSAGTFTAAGVAYAAEVLELIPAELKKAARDTDKAETVLYALLLSSDPGVEKKQFEVINENQGEALQEKTAKLLGDIRKLPLRCRLPLLEIAVSALKNIPEKRYPVLRKNINSLVKADGKISLFEYAALKMAVRHLDPVFNPPGPERAHYHSINPLVSECRVLLSVLAHRGMENSDSITGAFESSRDKLKLPGSPGILPLESCGLRELDRALKKLDKASHGIKRRVIAASAACVAADGRVTTRQSELIRIIADSLGCPVPPLFQSAPHLNPAVKPGVS